MINPVISSYNQSGYFSIFPPLPPPWQGNLAGEQACPAEINRRFRSGWGDSTAGWRRRTSVQPWVFYEFVRQIPLASGRLDCPAAPGRVVQGEPHVLLLFGAENRFHQVYLSWLKIPLNPPLTKGDFLGNSVKFPPLTKGGREDFDGVQVKKITY